MAGRWLPWVCAAAALCPIGLSAQGPVLTLQPGAVVNAVAGTGTAGYSGDNGAATQAELDRPAAVAYDAQGNLYIADAANHVIRKVTPKGIISTVAGNGQQGYSGDGGAAVKAELDTPTGVAVDAQGNLYIADSHNQRVRMVTPQGTIATLAGDGTAGYSGDGGAAKQAELDLPEAVAVDSGGDVYIADANNFRIREVRQGLITTVAGDGVQGFSGDGGQATAAELDTPTGVSVDAAGNLYIADRDNQRIRMVNAAGVIRTVAGDGSLSDGGDTGAATQAGLALPSGVAADGAGNVYIADAGNNVVRELSGGVINTVAGSGVEGNTGDHGPAPAAAMDEPRAVSPDAAGNVAIADTGNQRVRDRALATLIFAGQAVGTTSPAQTVTVSNSGSAALKLTTLQVSSGFTLTGGGSCGRLPLTLAPGASCMIEVALQPAATGGIQGALLAAGPGLTPATIVLEGGGLTGADTVQISGSSTTVYGTGSLTASVSSGTQAATGTIAFLNGSAILGSAPLANGSASFNLAGLAAGSYVLTARYSGDANYPAAASPPFALKITPAGTATTASASGTAGSSSTPAALTAMVISATSGTPTGSVTFMDSGASIGTAALDASGQATLAPAADSLKAGANAITAVYAGDANFSGSTSAAVELDKIDVSMAVRPGSITSATARPGSNAVYQLTVTPEGGSTFLSAVTFTVSGGPPGATYTVTPASLPAGSPATPITITVHLPQQRASLAPFGGAGRRGQFLFGSLPPAARLPGFDGRQGMPALLVASSSCLDLVLALAGLALLGWSARRVRKPRPGGAATFYLGRSRWSLGCRAAMAGRGCRLCSWPLRAASIGVLLGGAALLLAGCGGRPGNGYFGQQPKTYTIVLTATSGTASRSATMTLTVD